MPMTPLVTLVPNGLFTASVLPLQTFRGNRREVTQHSFHHKQLSKVMDPIPEHFAYISRTLSVLPGGCPRKEYCSDL